MSLKNTNNAERISPIPRINKNMHAIGINKVINFQVIDNPYAITKAKYTIRTKKKLILLDATRENKNIYFGTFTLEKMLAFAISEFIAPFVASL